MTHHALAVIQDIVVTVGEAFNKLVLGLEDLSAVKTTVHLIFSIPLLARIIVRTCTVRQLTALIKETFTWT